MINEALYNKTVNILYQSYFNNTLLHGNCYACAVGNIVAANMGFSYEENGVATIRTQALGWAGIMNQYDYPNQAFNNYYDILCGRVGGVEELNQIKATGYTIDELRKIEYAFESVDFCRNQDAWMFNGLVAVLDVLAEIHQVDKIDHDAAVQPFATHYATKQHA